MFQFISLQFFEDTAHYYSLHLDNLELASMFRAFSSRL